MLDEGWLFDFALGVRFVTVDPAFSFTRDEFQGCGLRFSTSPGLCKNRSPLLKNDSRSGPTRKRAGVTGGFAKNMGWRGV